MAVRPPTDVSQRLTETLALLRERDRDRALAWSDPRDHHVTLHYLGLSEPDAVMPALEDAIDRNRRGGPVPRARLGSELIELGTAIAVPVGGLDGLARMVKDAVEHLGQPSRHPEFLGHLTVGRWRPGRQRPPLPDLPPAIGGFEAETVELVRSDGREHRAGPRYECLERWSLAPT